MSKAASRVKSAKKIIEKVKHRSLVTNIPANMAAAGPPLGPMLGQVIRHLVKQIFYLFSYREALTLPLSAKTLMRKPKISKKEFLFRREQQLILIAAMN